MPLRIDLTLALVLASPCLGFTQAATLWTNTTTDPLYAQPGWSDVLALRNGGFVVCGPIEDTATGTARGIVRCWNAGGAVRWTYEFPDSGAPDDERPKKLALAPDGTIIMMGSRDSQQQEFIFARLDTQGNEIDHAVTTVNLVFNTTDVLDLVIDANGDLFAAVGSVNSEIVSFDQNFAFRWEDARVNFKDVALSAGGDLVACGNRFLGGAAEAWCVQLDDFGTLVWGTQFDAGTDITAPGLATKSNGEVMVATNRGKIHRLSATGAILGSTQTAIDYDHTLRYDEGTDTVVLAGTDFATRDTEISAFTGALASKWSVTRTATTASDFTMEMDRHGNTVVVISDDESGTNKNLKAFCYDVRGRLMWDAANTGTGTSDESVKDIAISDQLQICVAGGSEDHSSATDYGYAWRMSQFFHRSPDSATIRLGRLAHGSVASLDSDDGDEYQVCKFIVPNQQVRPIVVEFDVDFPIDNANPGATTLELRMRARANTPNLGSWIQLYDWNTATWTTSANYVLTVNEQLYDVVFSNVAPYFENNTRHVRARVAVSATGPVSVSVFCIGIDQFEFRSNTQ